MAHLPKGQGVFLPPFKAWLASNIPAVYDNTMTYYEELCALIKYLQDIVVPALNENASAITTISEAMEQLQKYVDEYFDNLDVQEEINNKLDEMAEDGTLAEIISSLDVNGRFNKSNTIGFHRVMRELILNENDPDYSANDYPAMQGGCYTSNDEFVQCSMRYDGSNNVKVRVINLTTGEVLRSAILQLQHANGVTYNPEANKLYITSLFTGSTYTHYVYVLDYTSLTLERTFDLTSVLELNEGTHSISYDNVTGKTILCTEYKNTNHLKFYYMNMTDGSLTHIPLEDYHNMLTKPYEEIYGTNDICVNDNILYILKQRPNVIVKYDLVTGKCLFVYNCQQYLRYGVYVGELESLSINPETNDFYVSCTYADTINGWRNIYSYLVTNFDQGIDDADLYEASGNAAVFVDAASTSINPTGTEGNAYKTIGEALQRLNLPGVKSLNVTVKPGTYPFVYFSGRKKAIIRPSQTSQPNNYIIKGVNSFGANFFITSMKIDGAGDNDIYMQQSEAILTWCRVSDKSKPVRLHTSVLHAEGILDTNSTQCKVQSDNSSVFDTHDTNPRYIFTDTIPTRTQDINLGNINSITTSAVSLSFANNKKPFTSTSNKLLLRINKDNSYAEIPFYAVSSTSTKYITANINGVIVKFQLNFDLTANTLSVRILNAIQLTSTTPSDVSSGLSYDSTLYLAK